MQLMMLSMIYVIITMSSESMKRIVEVLEETPALASPAEGAITEVRDGSVDFEGVSFKYSAKAERFALSDIDLHIESGMTVGILGGTGSSKTSLVQLIPRLYDATEGTVRVGGVDVRDYDLDTLRGAVALFPAPVCPDKTLILSLKIGKIDSKPSLVLLLTKNTSYPIFS